MIEQMMIPVRNSLRERTEISWNILSFDMCFVLMRVFVVIGMLNPIIQMNQGKTKSANVEIILLLPCNRSDFENRINFIYIVEYT